MDSESKTWRETLKHFHFQKQIRHNLAKTYQFESPTECQLSTWENAANNKNVLLCSPTGSGKTLAYLLPMVNKILNMDEIESDTVYGIILVPTVELANQIYRVLNTLVSPLGYPDHRNISISNLSKSIKSKSKKVANILIGMPVSVRHWLESESSKTKTNNKPLLADLRMMVIDEADLLLGLYDFDADINVISKRVPSGNVQFILSSATLNEDVQLLRGLFLADEVNVTVNQKKWQIDEFTISCDSYEKKMIYLYGLFKLDVLGLRAIVFVNSNNDAVKIMVFLRRFGYNVSLIIDEFGERQLSESLANFTAGKSHFLVVNDRGSDEGNKDNSTSFRGIDIPNVETVVNFDVPLTKNNYNHRIGRTGRGQNGVSILMTIPAKDGGRMTTIFPDGSTPLEFDPTSLKYLNCFTYRVSSVVNLLSKKIVNNAKQTEMRRLQSLALSDTLQSDKKQMRDTIKILEKRMSTVPDKHLDEIPSYLIRGGASSANLAPIIKALRKEADPHVSVTSPTSTKKRLTSVVWASGAFEKKKNKNIMFKKRGYHSRRK